MSDKVVVSGEELFRSIYEHSAMGMAVCDLAGRYLHVNAAACRFLGYSEQELLQRTFMDVTHPDDVMLNVQMRSVLLQDGGDAFQIEKRYVHKNGQMLWALTVVSVVCDRDRKPLYTIGQMLDISAQKHTEQELRLSRESLLDYRNQIQKLAAHDNLSIESERKRIAQEVHDDIGQLLTILKIDMQLCGASVAADTSIRKHTDEMLKLIDRTIASVRNITHHLRPPVLDLGLVPALEWLARDVMRRTTLQIKLNCRSTSRNTCRAIDDQVATAIFRVAQESITNIIRHANASAVTIVLDQASPLLVEITDNGDGFDVAAGYRSGGFGLLGMRERIANLGGTFAIESGAGIGTTLRLALPVTA